MSIFTSVRKEPWQEQPAEWCTAMGLRQVMHAMHGQDQQHEVIPIVATIFKRLADSPKDSTAHQGPLRDALEHLLDATLAPFHEGATQVCHQPSIPASARVEQKRETLSTVPDGRRWR